jgi:CRP-like cAMP-binding protein
MTPQLLALLKSNPLFQNLNDHALEQVAQAAHRLRKQDGEFFFFQGDPAARVHFVIQGKVKLAQTTGDGQQVLMEYIGPGRVFSIIAMLPKARYPVSSQAVGESEVLYWPREAIVSLNEQYPTLSANMMQLMATQIGEFQNRIRELSTQRVERRIARVLMRLARQTGQRLPDGVLIDLAISRQDLAEMTGTTLFTVSRTLKRWETNGLIESRREHVIIRQPHSLVKIAEESED